MKSSRLISSALLATVCLQCKENKIVDPDPVGFDLAGLVVFVSEGGGAALTDGLWAIDLRGRTGTLRQIVSGASDARAEADGRLVVYTKMSPQQSQDIYLNLTVGATERNITDRQQVSEFYPDIASNGSDIVFSALYGSTGATALCRVDTGGSGLSAITDTVSPTSQAWLPRWSPNGSVIAYIHRTQAPPSAKYALATIAPDGSAEKDLAPSSNLYAPQWSPDGKVIAYASVSGATAGISVFEVGSGTSKELTVPGRVLDPNGLVWTPAGDLYFLGRMANDSLFDVFYVSNAMTGTPVQISTGFRYPASVLSSPEGTTIAVLGKRDTDRVELIVMKSDGSQRTKILQLPAGAAVQTGGFAQWVGK